MHPVNLMMIDRFMDDSCGCIMKETLYIEHITNATGRLAYVGPGDCLVWDTCRVVLAKTEVFSQKCMENLSLKGYYYYQRLSPISSNM